MKKYKKIAIILMTISWLTGCSGERDADLTETEIAEKDTISEPEEVSEVLEREEIKIDYPFDESEEYTLTLAELSDSPNEYELLLYGKDEEVLQRIFCGELAEPITFAYDKCSRNDLEIFPAESDTGILFLWEDGRFLSDAVEIPKYAEVRGQCLITVMEDGDYLEKHFYELNKEKKRVDEIRTFCLDRNTGHIKIQDQLENKCIFEGIAGLDEEGNPINYEYYDMLIWQNMYVPRNVEEESISRVWEDKKLNPEEKAYRMSNHYHSDWDYINDNPECRREYESRQAFLEEFGFENCEPVYQYFDSYGYLQLELYADDTMENFCGIAYAYAFNYELEKITFWEGFTICNILEDEWKAPDHYLLKLVYGTDWIGEVTDYEEKTEYRDDGKPDYSEATGVIDHENDSERETILAMDFVYREDGTLYYRDYSHNDRFGSTWGSVNSFYDEKERVVYESGYITHGYIEYYYIYEDESNKPAYCLYLDHNSGYAFPEMVKYR